MGRITSLNPATAEVVGEVEAGGEGAVQEAVAAARRAAPDWGRRSFQDRARYILAARRYIHDHLGELARLISKENGKPLTESLSADLFPVMDAATFFAKKTARILRRERIWLGKWAFMGRTSWVEYHPVGVVGIISPWNFPFSIPAGQVIMALMAGNTVVLKPSELTPLIGLEIGKVFEAVGLPRGVLNVVPGDGVTGAALVASGVNKIVFTGSVATGKKIMEAAARSLTPVVLELGGKDPMVVLEDADLDVASSAAVWGAFSNAGQVCASVERLYLHERIAADFLRRCVEKTGRLRQGDGMGMEVEVGPLASPMQLQKVEEQVSEAVRRGAKVLIGGERGNGKGFFFKPTILENVSHDMAVMREETFGPVVGVMTFRDDEEAVRLANDSSYGLTASVWTGDVARGKGIARRIEAGTVTINENVYTYALAQTPWGGPKQSGIGRTHGRLGLLEMVEPRHIHLNRARWIKDFWWFRYDRAKYALMESLADVLFAGTLFKRVRSAIRFVWLNLRVKND